MNDRPDDSLLAAWSAVGSEEAFTALARRYGGLLYHAARRQTGRDDLAGEAAQNALLILARKAGRLRHLPCLSGWLHRTACYEAAKLLRRERRHEARMKHLPTEDGSPGDDWRDVAPLLDQALDALPEKDRQVIFLKYFDGMSFEQMARQFGGEPAAWRQRGSRAVERLRGSLAKRGVAVGAAGIASGLGSSLSQAAPASFIGSAGALHGAVATVSYKSLILNSLHFMKMKPVVVVSAVLLVSIVPLGLQAHAISAARDRVAMLEAELGSAKGGTGTSLRRTASARKTASSKTNLIALADSLLAAEQGDILKNLMVERKLHGMDAGELERMLLESLETEMGTAQRNVLVRTLFREFCRAAEKTKMPCEQVVELATLITRKMGTGQGNVWNSANGTLSRWMRTDPDGAVAWFREARKSDLLNDEMGMQVLAGTAFDGLYRRDPGEASDFYRSLSDREKVGAIGGETGRGHPELMLDLVNEITDEGLRRSGLSLVFLNSSGRPPEEIRGWLEQLQISENAAVDLLVSGARGNIIETTPENVVSRLEWIRKAGEGLDPSHAAGAFLAEMVRFNPAKSRAIIDAAWKADPDEKMLANYLGRSFQANPSLVVEAVSLSHRISDPQLRDDALRRMLTSARLNHDARALARKGGLTEEEVNRLIPEEH